MQQRPNLPVGLPPDIEDKKAAAMQWFESLRDQICAAFEKLEDVISIEEITTIHQGYQKVAGFDKESVAEDV